MRIKFGYDRLYAMACNMFVIIATLAIMIAVLYSFMVHHLAPDEVWGWLHTLVATVVSVVCAVAIGVALFNHQIKVTDRGEHDSFVRYCPLSYLIS